MDQVADTLELVLLADQTLALLVFLRMGSQEKPDRLRLHYARMFEGYIQLLPVSGLGLVSVELKHFGFEIGGAYFLSWLFHEKVSSV